MATSASSPAIRGKLFTPVNLARLLLVIFPSVPGLIFLVIGFLLARHTPSKHPTAEELAVYQHTAEQVKQLFLVGALTLVVGTVGMGVVIWKIARTHPADPGVPHENGEP